MMARSTLGPFICGVLLAACESAPTPPERPAGEPLMLRLVDDGWVELEGERMSVDRCAYRMRQAVREAHAAGAPAPWIDARTPADGQAWAGGMVQRIRDQAFAAGVAYLEFNTD